MRQNPKEFSSLDTHSKGILQIFYCIIEYVHENYCQVEHVFGRSHDIWEL